MSHHIIKGVLINNKPKFKKLARVLEDVASLSKDGTHTYEVQDITFKKLRIMGVWARTPYEKYLWDLVKKQIKSKVKRKLYGG